jgi:hypothetical protein
MHCLYNGFTACELLEDGVDRRGPDDPGSWTSRTRWGHSAADRVERELGKIDVWVNVAFPRPPATTWFRDRPRTRASARCSGARLAVPPR